MPELQETRPVRRRNRQPLSCMACRERKIRCDRASPCGPCTRRGAADTCCFEKRLTNGQLTGHKTSLRDTQPEDDVADIKKRLEQLETLLAEKGARTNGKSSSPTLPSGSLGNLPDQPIQVRNRSYQEVENSHSDVEDAALVLEGLTMDDALAFNHHRGRQAMRRAFDHASTSNSDEARQELAKEGIIDPMENPTTMDHAITLAQQHASQQWEPFPEYPAPCPMHAAGNNTSLLRLSSATESSLGWGMGWAFSAAEEVGRFDMMKQFAEKSSNPATTPERIAVLSAIIRTLPSLEQTELLLDVFERRAQPFVFNIVHMPTLRNEVRVFYSFPTPMCRARGLESSDPCWIGLLLMVLAIGLHFRDQQDAKLQAQLAQFTDSGYPALWHSAAKSVLVLSGYMGSSSMVVLQTILLLMFQCPRSTNQSPALLRVAISNAQAMGLHRLGDLSSRPKPDESLKYTTRRELLLRIWWALVVNDWRTAMDSTSPYMIQPYQFNTPLPGNLNSEDLLQPSPVPHAADIFTEMSFALSTIALAYVTRENTDLVNQLEIQQATDGKPRKLSCANAIELDAKYRGVLQQAPIFSDKISGQQTEELVAVQRWAFQQNVFVRLLQLHRAALSKKQARNRCVELARKVLSMQKAIRSRSDLADKLVLQILQSFNATTLLCLDLLYTPPTSVQRETIRAEIAEGLNGMCQAAQDAGLTLRGIRIIRALLDEEQSQWDRLQSQETRGNQPHTRTDLLRMALLAARLSRTSEFAPKNGTNTEAECRNENSVLPSQNPSTNPLHIFPPMQPTLTAFDPYLMGPNGFEIPMEQEPPTNMDTDLQSFLNNVNLPTLPNLHETITSATTPTFNNRDYENFDPSSSKGPQGGSTIDTHESSPFRASDSLSKLVPNLSHSSSPSTRSGSGSSQLGPSPSSQSPPIMDDFWNWIFAQGMQTDSSSSMPQVDGTMDLVSEAGTSPLQFPQLDLGGDTIFNSANDSEPFPEHSTRSLRPSS